MKTLQLFVFSLLAAANLAYGIEVPKEIHEFLVEKNATKAEARFEAIPSIPAPEFAADLARPGSNKIIGAGFNGMVLKDNTKHIIKLTYEVLAAGKKVKTKPYVKISPERAEQIVRDWAPFLESAPIRSIDVSAIRKSGEDDEVGVASLREELYGSLIWSAYSAEEVEFPDGMSSDGLSYRRKFLEGTPLKAILESQREGGTVHQKYNLRSIWRQVVDLQETGEAMMYETGATVDMLNSGNFLVSGDPMNPHVRAIDHSLIIPSKEAKAYYAARGHIIPEPRFQTIREYTLWPNVPEQIVNNIGWNLNFEQALDYVQALHRLSSRAEAVEKLAAIEEMPIEIAPVCQVYSAIRIAKLVQKYIPGKLCEMLLLGPGK